MHLFSRPPGRAAWIDGRVLLGGALVALSVGGVWLVLTAAGSTTPVLQAARTIVQGEALTSGDFDVVEVNLAGLTDAYLAPQEFPSGQVAARTLTEGELVPSSATSDADASRTTTIVIPSSTGVPADVGAGTVVEIWHAPPVPDTDDPDTPRILVADAVIASVSDPEGMLASSSTTVEVVIDRAQVADVLAAITNGSALSIVPTGSER